MRVLFLICILRIAFAGTGEIDYYKRLGVPRDAKPQEIKSAYRKLARLHHPDVNPENPSAEKRFQEIADAYSTLYDPERRRVYDGQVSRYSYRRSKRHSSANVEQDTQYLADLSKRWSNKLWTYDGSTRSFVDHRTGIRSVFRLPESGFYSNQFIEFFPRNGIYYDWRTEATWDVVANVWFRKDPLTQRQVRVDPLTGYDSDYRMTRLTRTEMSPTFDKILDFMNFENRALFIESVKPISEWTVLEREDYLDRATTVLKSLDGLRGVSSSLDNRKLETLFGHRFSIEFPELVEAVIQTQPGLYADIISHVLSRDEWLTHPKTAGWLDHMMERDPNSRSRYLDVGLKETSGEHGDSTILIRSVDVAGFGSYIKHASFYDLDSLIKKLFDGSPSDYTLIVDSLAGLADSRVFLRAMSRLISSSSDRMAYSDYADFISNLRPFHSEAIRAAIAIPSPEVPPGSPQSFYDEAHERVANERIFEFLRVLDAEKKYPSKKKAAVICRRSLGGKTSATD